VGLAQAVGHPRSSRSQPKYRSAAGTRHARTVTVCCGPTRGRRGARSPLGVDLTLSPSSGSRTLGESTDGCASVLPASLVRFSPLAEQCRCGAAPPNVHWHLQRVTDTLFANTCSLCDIPLVTRGLVPTLSCTGAHIPRGGVVVGVACGMSLDTGASVGLQGDVRASISRPRILISISHEGHTLPTTGREVTRKTLDNVHRQGVRLRLSCHVRLGTQ
jgi:hypothetical protein